MMPMEKRLEENNVKNENDRKKTYLRAYRKHGKRIKRIESEIEEIRNMKMYPSSINNGMPHGSNQSDLSSYAVALQEREDELYQEGVKQVQTYKDIEYRINKLENQDERDVMFYKYIKGFTWWQIAQLMEYSESWIYELHGRALKNIQIN
jgi:DNA-directed RNA polymerase specialized sigma subunit